VTDAQRGPHVRQVAWDHPDAVRLRAAMTTEMDRRYADRAVELPLGMAVDPADLRYTAVAYLDGHAVGHVALRRLGLEIELKRLFVEVDRRGGGIARVLLTAAELAARDLGARRVILQTGDRQPEAVAAYQRAGYTPIPVFPPYVELPFSLCFEKRLPALVGDQRRP
jgi:GNAT superfamily N-acetyltransferase